MRWDGDGHGANVGDDVDDDLDDARDDDDYGDDIPFREVISPAESARLRWLFSSVGFRPVAAVKHGNDSSLGVSTPRGLYRRKGAPRGATRHPSGCLVGPLTSILGDPQSIFIKNTPSKFSSHLDLI